MGSVNCCNSGIQGSSVDELAVVRDAGQTEMQDGRRGKFQTPAKSNLGFETFTATKEELEWFNYGFSILWSEMNESVHYILGTHVLPRIKEKMPPQVHDVKFSRFTLGEKPATFGPVEVSRLPRGACRLSCELQYYSDLDAEMSITSKLGVFTFGMKDFRLCGNVVLWLRPFMKASPGLGSVSVYFANVPYIDFTFAGNGHHFGNFPMIKSMLIHAISSCLSDKLVVPHTVTVLIGLRDFKVYPVVFDSPTPLGVLRATVLEIVLDKPENHVVPDDHSNSHKRSLKDRAKNFISSVKHAAEAGLEWVDHEIGQLTGHKTEPYLKLMVGNLSWQLELKSTSDKFDFAVFDPDQFLRITCWDRDVLSNDDVIGRADPLDIEDAVGMSNKQIILRLPGSQDRMGHVKLHLQWLLHKPKYLNDDGCLVRIRIQELLHTGVLSEAWLAKGYAIRGKLCGLERSTPPGSIMKSDFERPVCKQLLNKVREALKKEQVDERTINRALHIDTNSNIRIAINHSLHFVVETPAIDTASLELSIVSIEEKTNAKKIKERTEMVISTQTISLLKVKKSEDFIAPGPIDFTGSFGKFSAQIFIQLMGLQAQEYSRQKGNAGDMEVLLRPEHTDSVSKHDMQKH